MPWSATVNPRYAHVVFADELRRRCRTKAVAFRSVHPKDPNASDAPPLTPVEHDFVHALFEEFGMDASAYRPQAIRRRLPACLRALKCDSVHSMRQLLERRPELRQAALHA